MKERTETKRQREKRTKLQILWSHTLTNDESVRCSHFYQDKHALMFEVNLNCLQKNAAAVWEVIDLDEFLA